MKIYASRYHDFSYGHTVCGHESKCAHLHGHNGRVTFHCEAPALDELGRVIDFGVIKGLLCRWVEECWDHRFLIWKDDPRAELLRKLDPPGIVLVDYNPTAENLAGYLLEHVGPGMLEGTGVTLVRVDFEETRKCGVTVTP